ncbi:MULTISPECIES: helix-turn-helix domain-containing protein [Cupriavidus]|nr:MULTISPECIES: helix-turn-helix transcriptional regulator [Cupriavidus]QYY34249.1 helix-turn-helix transcriptional regulator [Cupriavidus pinatubonensis]TPQ29996.1 XRE family transcriptional regulator [Cupriavidus pinatubonensis]
MPRKASAVSTLPGPVSRSLIQLGQNLRLARKRRKETMAAFAERMQVSVPTLRKMEQGDPTVSIAVYAMALWLVGRLKWLPEVANPAADEVALDLEITRIQRPAATKSSQSQWKKS